MTASGESKPTSERPAWVAFEEQCWEKAKEDFYSGVKTEDKDLAGRFLKDQSTLSGARDACKTVERDADARYSTKDSPSVTIAGVKINPKALFVKLLNNLDIFISMGDVAVKGGPESVGLIWMGLKMGLQAINADYETCGIITACFSDIIGVFISCRMYAQLYGPALFEDGLVEVQDRVRTSIPSMLRDILDFAFSASKFIHQNELKRWAKAFFKDSKATFNDKAKCIRDHHAKLVADAEQAAHQESTLRGRADSENIKNMLKTLNGLSNQIEEERKMSKRKTFDEVQLDIFDQNTKNLNPSVDRAGLMAHNIKIRAVGTCQWIFDRVSMYHEWRASKENSMLWVSGEAGFGKSILLSTVVERLNGELSGRDDTLVHYFFCRTGNNNTQLVESILGNILFQLYESSTSSPRLLEQCNNLFRDDKIGPRAAGKPQTTQSGPMDYIGLYLKMGAILQKTVYLIVDAIDECSDDVTRLCTELCALLKAKELSLKLLVSSRPQSSITAELEGAGHEVRIKEYNGPDIMLKVQKELSKIPGLSAKEQEYATNKITKKAEGEFSYVDTAINILREPWRRTAAGQRSLEDVLEKLPPGMHGSYDMMFRQISPTHVELAKTFLNWALLTEGDITVQEIMDAYNDAFGHSDVYLPYSSDSSNGYDKSQQDTLAEQLERAVGNFLEIEKKPQVGMLWTIKLRHASVKDYFLEETAPDAEGKVDSPLCLCAKCGANIEKENDVFKVYQREGHLNMAITLLRHLNSPLFQKTFTPIDDREATLNGDAHEANAQDGEGWLTSSEWTNTDKEQWGDGPEWMDTNTDEWKDSPRWPNSNQEKEEGAEGDLTKEMVHNQEGIHENGLETESSAETLGPDPIPTQKEEDYVSDGHGSDVELTDCYRDDEDNYRYEREIYDEAVEDKDMLTDAAPRQRYEVTHWVYHVQEAEKRWSAVERRANRQWTELYDQLEQYLTSDAFKKTEPPENWGPMGAGWLRYDGPSPLHVACCFGWPDIAEEFLRRGYDISQPSTSGDTPLEFATKANVINVRLLRVLLGSKADPNVGIGNDGNVSNSLFAKSPFLSLLRNHPTAETVQLLVDHGADCVNPQNLPIQFFASESGTDPAVLEILVKNGADINAADEYGETSFHHLLRRSTPAPVELVQAFLKSGARLDIDDRDSQQPLFEAAQSGNLAAVREILKHEPGPDIADQDFLNMTAVHIAAVKGHTEIIALLKEGGAPLNQQDVFGRTPLMLACQGREPKTALLLLECLSDLPFPAINLPDRDGRTPFRKAARRGFVDVLRKFLTFKSADMFTSDRDNGGSTPLHIAALNGRDAAVKLLLEHGADLEVTDNNGRTTWSLCMEEWIIRGKESSEKALVLLIAHTPQQTLKNSGLLYTAAKRGSLPIVKALIDQNLDPIERDEHGWSALAIARQFGHKDVSDYLEIKGAEIKTRPTRFINSAELFRVSADGLHIEPKEYVIIPGSSGGCILSDHPIPVGGSNFYFEVTVEEDKRPDVERSPTSEEIAIGLSTKPIDTNIMPEEACPQTPLWFYQNQGGGIRFHFKEGYLGPEYSAWWFGDTVGCAFEAKQNLLFFTLNGKRTEAAFEDVRGQLFPFIGLRGIPSLRANFGHQAFMWEDAEQFLRG